MTNGTFTLQLVLTNFCNLSCRYCYVLPGREAMPLDVACNAVDEAAGVCAEKGVPFDPVSMPEIGSSEVYYSHDYSRAGIAAAVPGGHVGDIGAAVQSVAEGAGYGVVRDYCGHGVGRHLHEEPQIPNFGKRGKGPELLPGMCLAIEPMVNLGTWRVDLMRNEWTVKTKDRKPSAHFEHTVLVTEDGPEVLTVPVEPER